MYNAELRRLICDKCKSQKNLAEQVGITPTIMSLMVRGTVIPAPPLQKKIAKALGTSPEKLFPTNGV